MASSPSRTAPSSGNAQSRRPARVTKKSAQKSKSDPEAGAKPTVKAKVAGKKPTTTPVHATRIAQLGRGLEYEVAADVPGVKSEIIARVRKWAGGDHQALAWYRAQPISAFGDRTAEALVKSGQAEALRDYLNSLALGGFA